MCKILYSRDAIAFGIKFLMEQVLRVCELKRCLVFNADQLTEDGRWLYRNSFYGFASFYGKYRLVVVTNELTKNKQLRIKNGLIYEFSDNTRKEALLESLISLSVILRKPFTIKLIR